MEFLDAFSTFSAIPSTTYTSLLDFMLLLFPLLSYCGSSVLLNSNLENCSL